MSGSNPPELSLVVTTYGSETRHTQLCLGHIRRWKRAGHELIVVVHDETPLLRLFLELCRKLGIIDRLILAAPGHGHVRGVNLGFSHASADLVFNICVDMRVGGSVLSDCAALLRRDRRVGAVGWHYDWSPEHEGTYWRKGKLIYARREFEVTAVPGRIEPHHLANIRAASWHTGRVLDAVGSTRFICCNGSFFGTRLELWNRIGGFDEARYPGHWADDFFTYAVLDQGLDVRNLPRRYRCRGDPYEFLALTDRKWQGKPDLEAGQDAIDWSCRRPNPGLTPKENIYLDMLGRVLQPKACLAFVGRVPWRPDPEGRGPYPRFVEGTDAGVLPACDVIACGPGSFSESYASRLKPGGLLIIFGGGTHFSKGQALDSIRIWRPRDQRVAFARQKPVGDVREIPSLAERAAN